MPGSDTLQYAKPETLFDRDAEWDALAAFAGDRRPEPGLGVVSGRLRQGKTYLLQKLTAETGGFYFAAQEAAPVESLRRLGEEFARYSGDGPPSHWRGWEDAVDALLALGGQRPLPVVIDEFPHLVRQSPELPSAIHRAFQRIRARGTDGGSRTRLLLCGSPRPIMSRLFGASSPLRALADLDLTVRPLDFRQAARFWGTADPRLALLVHAVVGGSPAYRCAYVGDDTPGDERDFDAWVCRTALNPGLPLYHEADHLLDDEAGHNGHDLCHSVLGAVALGFPTEGAVAKYLDTPLGDLSRCVEALRESELLEVGPDAFRPKVHRLQIGEPLLAFEHAVTRPHRSALEQGTAADVWRRARTVFHQAVMEPHFALACREWAARFASAATFGAPPASAAHGCLDRPGRRAALDAEVVVRGQGEPGRAPLLSVGVARWNEVMDLHHLERIRHLLTLLATRGEDITHARPACYSGTGFSPGLRAAEEQGDVVLVDLDRLYRGR
ncbi:ATP-binding protein [Streptomyces sp. HPF1205]|uniref:AAA family ATPase n=1 Tax=Streptomyces sp. HPF1205 TaxID=2873262 RepID=UPI001CECE53D|nr:ArsR family transcriptional regulator [Streptomyces sp. HPF1205]